MLQLFRLINTALSTVLLTASTALLLRFATPATSITTRVRAHQRDERGEAVPWLIVLGAGIAIAYFAGDSVMAFAKNLVGQLGN